MSSKKKKVIGECEKCKCVVLCKDLDKHLSDCSDNLDKNIITTPKKASMEDGNEIPILKNDEYLFGFNIIIDKKGQDLPPEFYGWYKKHIVLLNKETMNLLGIFPKTSLLLESENEEKFICYAWPCKDVPLMKLSCSLLNNDSYTKVFVIKNIKKLNNAIFEIISEQKELFKSEAFLSYLKVYLSMAYLSPSTTIGINYFGQNVVLQLKKNLIDMMNSFSVNSECNGVINEIYTLTSEASINIEGNIKEIANGELRDIDKCILSMNKLGGMVKGKKDIEDFIITPFKNNNRVCSSIIYGLTGTGKTLLLKILDTIMRERSIIIKNCAEFESSFSSLLDRNFIILIDNFDSWIGNSNAKGAINLLNEYLDENTLGSVIVSIRDIDLMDLHLRRRFSLEIEMPVPTFVERKDIMNILLNSEEREFVDKDEVAHQTHGFTGSDLKTVCQLSRQGNSKNNEEFLKYIKRVRPTGIRQFIFEVPNVSWDDIGGNDELKEEIQQAVIWPQQHADAFVRFGVDPPSGILLYGPPGCSKTLVARALASQSRLNFLSVKGPELFSKYVGESEKAVRDLFHRARQVAPTILFFDEIDAVGGKRGADNSSAVGDRVLAQLLTELDGLEKKSRVIVLAATNRPDTIDSALMRPGRLDRSIYVPLPDFNTREQIIKLRLKRMTLGKDVNIHHLSQLTSGYSGAEIVAFCQVAALKAMRENIESGVVELKHFESSLKEVVPRTDKELLECYERFQKGDY
uniref:ATPase_AAA_core domain-containing protein n=1 Tax=Parastrongyloides trichosuri TaxID=131310 RepID=A0A0N5A4X0_PARTI